MQIDTLKSYTDGNMTVSLEVVSRDLEDDIFFYSVSLNNGSSPVSANFKTRDDAYACFKTFLKAGLE